MRKDTKKKNRSFSWFRVFRGLRFVLAGRMGNFEAVNPGFEGRVRAGFEGQRLMTTLHAELTKVEPARSHRDAVR